MNDTNAQELIKLRKENACLHKQNEYAMMIIEVVAKALISDAMDAPNAWVTAKAQIDVLVKLIETEKREYLNSCK